MRLSRQGARIFALSFEIIGLILAGAWVGKELDRVYQWRGLGVAGGVILALILWFVHVIQAVKQAERDESRENK